MVLFLKNLVFTVVVPGTVAVYIPLRMGHGGWPTVSASWGWSQFSALPVLALGAATYVWCVWRFGTTGRGTPAPVDAPTRLVVVGPYRHVRNPMYMAVLSVVTGWAIFFLSWAIFLYGCVVAIAFHSFVVFIEEPGLHRQFGESYERYCREVRRWTPRKTSRRAG